MNVRARVLAAVSLAVTLTAACTTEPAPSKGTYTIAFPSTAAAVATDFVQVLVFDTAGKDKGSLCQDLITQRATAPDDLIPSVNPPERPVNICAMLAGRLPVNVPYGEHALLAIAQRKDAQDQSKDFMIGCAIMTIGDGDAPIPIPVRLVNVSTPVPPTKCGSVGEFCEPNSKCL